MFNDTMYADTEYHHFMASREEIELLMNCLVFGLIICRIALGLTP